MVLMRPLLRDSCVLGQGYPGAGSRAWTVSPGICGGDLLPMFWEGVTVCCIIDIGEWA